MANTGERNRSTFWRFVHWLGGERQPSSARSRVFDGGLRLPLHKDFCGASAVAQAGIAPRLILPLQQHIGLAARPTVKPGDAVDKGQLLAQADGYVSASLHAPTSGTIAGIEFRPVPHPSNLTAPCIVLDSDGQDRWAEAGMAAAADSGRALTPTELRRRLREAGVVGLGGAMFPAPPKLDPGAGRSVKLLIINGAECEPYANCDNALMRTRAASIVSGARIICRALAAETCLIGIEDSVHQAGEALNAALAAEPGRSGPPIEVRTVPTIYPAGGEKQLIKALTGMEVPGDGLPVDLGIVCLNVGTAAAVHDAVRLGRPLVSRYVTVSGSGVKQPLTLETPIGTPIRDLIRRCGGYTDSAQHLVYGGPMAGFCLTTDDVPIIKGTNCILVLGADEVVPARAARPCIRCGECARACPARLLPQQLYWYARADDFDAAQDYHLFDCIECGCCDLVCPSHIPLLQHFRYAKTEVWAQERTRQHAATARQRYEFRTQRLQRETLEKQAKLRRKQAALGQVEDHGDRQAAIQAALERVRARRRTAQGQRQGDSDA